MTLENVVSGAIRCVVDREKSPGFTYRSEVADRAVRTVCHLSRRAAEEAGRRAGFW